MLKQRARDRLYKRAVGALVLASVLVLIYVLRLYQQTAGPFDQSFRLQAIAPKAHGLEIDSPVTMAGLRIGRVIGIAVTAENTIKLELEMQGKYRERVRDDSLASLSRPLIGSSFIDLSMGTPGRAEIPSGGYIGLTTLPDINDVVAGLAPKLEKVDAILDNVTLASADFKALIRQVGHDVEPLRRSMDNVEKTTAEAAAAATAAKALVAGVDRAVGEARQAVADAGKAVGQLNAILADVKQGTARVDTLVGRADNILANGEAISADLKQVAPRIVPVLDSGRDALNEADDVLRAAKNNVLLRGNLPPPSTQTLPATPR